MDRERQRSIQAKLYAVQKDQEQQFYVDVLSYGEGEYGEETTILLDVEVTPQEFKAMYDVLVAEGVIK